MGRFGYLLLVTSIFVGWNCVGPEEPTDGLLDDLPAVVNTADVFTFNLKGNKYSFEEQYTLSMQPDSNSVLTTSLIVQNWSGNDTSCSHSFRVPDASLPDCALITSLVAIGKFLSNEGLIM